MRRGGLAGYGGLKKKSLPGSLNSAPTEPAEAKVAGGADDVPKGEAPQDVAAVDGVATDGAAPASEAPAPVADPAQSANEDNLPKANCS